MIKYLYLIRHSYAENAGFKRDIERDLTHEGLATVRALGRHLTEEKFQPEVILCSPANRTNQTAVNLVEALGLPEQIIDTKPVIYEASVREMLMLVNEIDQDIHIAAIIGHNPTITYFAEYATNQTIGNMEPCSVAKVGFEGMSWAEVSQSTGTLKEYYHPNH